jgi:deazaflavin-dependent oxidoreductase (nitroreductase family)
MSLEGTYEPSPSEWVRNQVAAYEASGGTEANTLMDTGMPIVVVTTRGNKSGSIRKTPLMRVEHDGAYALVASQGGAPTHPVWYHNITAAPSSVRIQDGPEPFDVDVHEATGDERALWWERAVAAYPPYAEYQTRTERTIPVLIATKRA